MKGSIGLLNIERDVEDELFIYQCNGEGGYLPQEVKMAIFQSEYELEDWGSGDWIIVVDGEIVGKPDTVHPWGVEIREDN